MIILHQSGWFWGLTYWRKKLCQYDPVVNENGIVEQEIPVSKKETIIMEENLNIK